MARFNEILAARYARAWQKLFQIKGTVPTPVLSSEIQPVIAHFRGVEDRFTESWYRFAQLFATGGTAATGGEGEIRNPLGSNLLVVIEKINAWSPIGNTADRVTVQYGKTNTDLTNILGAPQSMDGRIDKTTSLITSTSTTNPLSQPTIGNIGLPTAGSFGDFILTDDTEIPLLPGWALNVIGNTVGVSQFIGVTITWRERFLEEAERQ